MNIEPSNRVLASSRSVARLYLAQWEPESDTYKTMRSALDSVAKALSDDPQANHLTFDWLSLTAEAATSAPAKIRAWLRRGGGDGEAPSPRTVNKYLSALRGLLRRAWRAELIDDAAYRRFEFKNVKGSRLPAGRVLVPSEKEVFRQYLQNVTPHDAAMLAVLRACGLRRIEVARLRKENYDPLLGVVRALGKGDKEREIPVGSDWRPWIDAHWKTRKRGALMFTSRRLRPLTRRAISWVVDQYCLLAGIDPPITPHDLRRTFGTELLDAGIDLGTVAELMGHGSVDTTLIYDRRSSERKRTAVGAIK